MIFISQIGYGNPRANVVGTPGGKMLIMHLQSGLSDAQQDVVHIQGEKEGLIKMLEEGLKVLKEGTEGSWVESR